MSYLETSKKIRWHYNVFGRGKCIFFIHGWAANMRVFVQQARYFSKDHQVVLIDLPGHGKTNWQPIDFQEIACQIRNIADEIGAKKFDIIGSSMGGFIGLKIAEVFPVCVRKLVMVGSLPRFLKTQEQPVGLTSYELDKLRKQLETRYPEILDIFFRSLFTLEERESEKFKWIHRFRKQERTPDKQALEYFLEMLTKADLMNFLPVAKVPILFIAGRKDYICSESSLNFLKDVAPQAKIDFIENSGHFPFLIKSEEFNEKVEDFLK